MNDRVMKHCARRIAGMAAVLAIACASPTDDGNGHDVRGNWRYTASQSFPISSLAGTLVVSQQTGNLFSGQLDVQETTFTGVQIARAGAATGRALASASVDFDALLGAVPRRHIARITGDTMTGTWIETAANTILTGNFRAVRMVLQ